MVQTNHYHHLSLKELITHYWKHEQNNTNMDDPYNLDYDPQLLLDTFLENENNKNKWFITLIFVFHLYFLSYIIDIIINNINYNKVSIIIIFFYCNMWHILWHVTIMLSYGIAYGIWQLRRHTAMRKAAARVTTLLRHISQVTCHNKLFSISEIKISNSCNWLFF